jgi:thiol:disulfide interchange protein DsbC
MMVKRLFITLILLSGTAIADKNMVINNLERFFGTIEKEDIIDSPFNGVYEVIVYNPVDSLLVSKDGQYIIQGDVIDLSTRKLFPINDKVKLIKATLINSISDQDKIIYKADNEKYSINVFTDVDCPFCRKLHLGMDKMNDLGITVKYLAAPLASLHPTAQNKMQKIWCADDRNLALDNYNIDKEVPVVDSCNDPVAEQLSLSKQLSVTGTPALFLSDGTHLPGYLKPDLLLKKIETTLGK